MKGTLAVAAREIAERKLLFLGAFVAGVLPLGFPLLPALRGNAHDARSVAMLLLTITIAVAFPLVFGATILVGDIAEKRLSFYFSRPLPAASIWAGKLLAALLISIGCALLAAAPVFFVEGNRAFSFATVRLDTPKPLVSTILGILLLLLFAHVVASMARLKSAWIVLDFVLAAFFAVAITLCLRSLFLSGFWSFYEQWRSPERALWWLPVALIAILLAASYVQVADGRTDARRSHGALSATLWGVVALLTLPLAGLAWWVNAAAPKDLSVVDSIQAAPHGTWVSISGRVPARGSAEGMFLYDTTSGRFIKRPHSLLQTTAFSADGTRGAFFQADPGFFEWTRTGAVRIAALDATKPAVAVSDIETNVWANFALSPSGRRLAVLDGQNLAAYDISNPSHARQVLALRVERRPTRLITFVGEDVLRRYPFTISPPEPLEIDEISLPSKKSLVTGHLEREYFSYLYLSEDGRYLVGREKKRLTLHDGRTGTLLATLSEDLERPEMRFLSGGRMAVAGVAGGRGVLKIFLEGERTPSRHVELGPASAVALGGEVAPRRVAISLSPFRNNDERSWEVAAVDVVTGAVSHLADGLVPADRFSWSPVLPPAEAGLPASRLFLDASGALVRLDPATGKQEILLGGRR